MTVNWRVPVARDPDGMAAREDGAAAAGGYYLHKFRLYETTSQYYMVGRDKTKTVWRVLKIDRTKASELFIREDSATYSESECYNLLMRIHEGNRSTGGLKFVTSCYGIVGFIKFLGPYYMLLITKRRLIGTICGHKVYVVAKSEVIALPNPLVQSNMVKMRNENRYKRLLGSMDLTKDFFFSYSYHIMRTLQKNISDSQSGQLLYDTMFVWNEYLTRGMRYHLKSTLWTVPLVHGFFKQAKLSLYGKDFWLTLIARRSRHFAGPRYLKRGINDEGMVANDVEIEQIVFEDRPGGIPTQITSVVQNRGSIPLFWSQETSRLNIRPDIILHKKDKNYEATRLHFENLVKRYGKPIIILNLIKTREKKPRESILRAEFATAIDFINKDLPEDDQLLFFHWDLNRVSRRDVLPQLGKVASEAMTLTGFFNCQVTPSISLDGDLKWPFLGRENVNDWSYENHNDIKDTDIVDTIANGSEDGNMTNSTPSGLDLSDDKIDIRETYMARPPVFQKGVVRTNCIDCLDRTNVAQYAYGLAALGDQLHALGFIHNPKTELDSPLNGKVMKIYETMGDTLALQYGGSAAHNKIFCERRGQWKAATRSQEFFRTLQRYYNNAYMDAEKQDAINLFLGHFQPQQGSPALWELDPDQHHNIGRYDHGFAGGKGRCAPMMPDQQHFAESEHSYFCEHKFDPSDCSNFLDLDWLLSSENSYDEEIYNRSSLVSSPVEILSTENVIDNICNETSPPLSESGSGMKGKETTEMRSPQGSDVLSQNSEIFVHWVIHGNFWSFTSKQQTEHKYTSIPSIQS